MIRRGSCQLLKRPRTEGCAIIRFYVVEQEVFHHGGYAGTCLRSGACA